MSDSVCLVVCKRCLSLQAMSLAGGQLLSLDELKSLLTQLTAHTTAHPLSSSDVQAAGRLLSQLIPVVPAYSSEQVSNLIKV